MNTLAKRAADRRQIEAQRAVAQRILDEMENPTPLKPEVAAKARAFDAWARGDAPSADVKENR